MGFLKNLGHKMSFSSQQSLMKIRRRVVFGVESETQSHDSIIAENFLLQHKMLLASNHSDEILVCSPAVFITFSFTTEAVKWPFYMHDVSSLYVFPCLVVYLKIS